MKTLKILLILFMLFVTGCFSSKSSVSEEADVKEESSFVEEISQPQISEMSLFMTGDGLLHGAVYKDAYNGETYDFSYQLEILKPIIEKYDLAYYNQETILGGVELELSGYPMFNSPQEFGRDMVALGFNLVSLANNHSLDRSVKGIENSLRFWHEQDGVVFAGTYLSQEERDEIPVYECNGISYTFLSYTYGCNGLIAPEGMEYLVNVYDDEMLLKDVKIARKKSDVVIVAMHWGNEYTHTPTEEQKRLANMLAKEGVDIIIGNHPHVIQPIEWIDDTLVVYSCGNMISAQDQLPRNIGLMVGIDIKKVDNQGDIKVELSNLRADLLFTSYNSHWTDFRLYTFDLIEDTILNNHEEIFEEYWQVVTSLENEINRGV